MYARWSCPPWSTMDEWWNCEDVETTLQYKLYIDDSECSVSPNELDVIYGKVLNATGTTLQWQDSLPIPIKDGYTFKWYAKEPNSTELILKYKGGKIATSIHFNESNFVVDHDSRTATIYPVFELIRYIYNPDANITYTDTNWKEFTWIWTITITDGENSITMLDRNLGATSTDITSKDSYGYHFQWWNNYGFTRVENESDAFSWSGTLVDGSTEWYADTSENARNNPYVNSGFIMDPSWDNNGWWDEPYNHDLRWWANDYNNWWWDSSADYKRQWPCPAGYHVPSQKELDDLLQMYYALNPSWTLGWSDYGHYVNNQTFSTNFREAFKMPFAGSRDLEDGKVYDMGGYANLWSSSAYDDSYPDSRGLYLGADDVGAGYDDHRGFARSVRCFLDSPLDNSWAKPLTLEYETDGGSAIQSQAIPAWWKAYLPWYTTHKDGANFLGWYNENGTEQYDLEIWVPTNNFIMSADIADENGVVKVYAKWWYKVTFVDWNWSWLKVEPVEAWGSATAPEVPERDWYEFSGWDTDFSNVTTDITVTALYKTKQYTITYELDWWTNNPNNVTWYTIETPTITLENPTKEWYTFDGWFIDSQFSTWITTIPTWTTWNITLYAKWTAKSKPSWGYSGGGSRSSSKDAISNDSEKSSEQPAWSQVDSSEQTPQNDNSNTQDSSANASEWQNQQQFTQEFQQAYEFAHEKWITTMPTINDANMNWKLTRIAMAKMLSQYAINVLWQKPANIVTPKFNDVTNKQNADYDDGVTLAYQLWIMWQNMPNNNFRPNDEVTRAEFATALSRMLYQTSDWEYKWTWKYYLHHMEKLVKEWIITNDNPNMKELRGYVMIMLMRSAK